MDKNTIVEVNLLKSICLNFLDSNNDTITLSSKDISFINKILTKFAECEKKILDQKYSSSNLYKLDFNFENLEPETYGYYQENNKNCKIRIASNTYKVGQNYSKDEFAEKILLQLNTIIHEFNHFKQHLEMKSEEITDYGVYRMSAENVIRHEYPHLYYKNNYYTVLIELESRLVGMRKIDNLINAMDGFEKSKELLKNNTYISDKDHFIENIYLIAPKTIDGAEYQEQEIFRNQQLDYIIRHKPEYLNKYPILKYKYNENGSKKSILELVNTLFESHKINKEIDPRLAIELLTDTVESARISELIDFEKAYPDSKVLYEFLLKENQNRYDYEKAMLQKLKINLSKSLKNKDQFIVQNLGNIIDNKYDRRFKMLDMYSNKKYQEGYNIINYQTLNGVDLPYEKANDIDGFDNLVNAILLRDNIINVYNNIEDNQDFSNRYINQNKDIKFVLNAIQTKRIPDDFLNKFDILSKNITSENFKEFAHILRIADNLSLTGGKNYLLELSSIPEIRNIYKRIINSDVYKNILEQSEKNPTTIKKSLLDYQTETANTYLNSISNPSAIIDEIQSLKEIDENDSPERLAIFKIINRQNGYLISSKGSKICRSNEPVWIDSNRKKVNNYINNIFTRFDFLRNALRSGTTKSDTNEVRQAELNQYTNEKGEQIQDEQ